MRKQVLRKQAGVKESPAEFTDDYWAPAKRSEYEPARARWPDGYEADVPNLCCCDVPIKTQDKKNNDGPLDPAASNAKGIVEASPKPRVEEKQVHPKQTAEASKVSPRPKARYQKAGEDDPDQTESGFKVAKTSQGEDQVPEDDKKTEVEQASAPETAESNMPPIYYESREHNRVCIICNYQKTGPEAKKRNPIVQIIVKPMAPLKHFQVAQVTPKEPITMLDAYLACKRAGKIFAAGGVSKEQLKANLTEDVKEIYKQKSLDAAASEPAAASGSSII